MDYRQLGRTDLNVSAIALGTMTWGEQNSEAEAFAQIERAKAVCNSCDVRETCLQWAMEHNQDSGVWGGLSEDERRSLKRRAARARRAAK